MPSISQLFGPDQADDPNFDLDDFLGEAERAAEGSPEHQYAMGGSPEPVVPGVPPVAPAAASEVQAGGGEGGDGAGEATVPAPPVAAPPLAPVDPLLALPPERRAALLALDEAITTDPSIRDRVFEAIRPSVPKPPPSLPEHVDPESVEARLWAQNQEILARLDRQDTDRQAERAAQTQQQRLVQAASAAGANFESRYPQLTSDELSSLGTRAFQSGLPQVLVARPGADLVASYEEALEHTLWTDPTLRARVVGAAAPPAAPVPPVGPTVQGEQNKRVLHALSGAATPIAGPPPASAKLETRADGTLTSGSKDLLVNQLAASLRERG